MQQFYVVKEVFKDKLKRGYEFTVRNDHLEEKVMNRLKEVMLNVRLDGFRKGKVSLDVVKKHYGDSVAAEVISQVLEEVSASFLKENGFEDVVTSDVKVVSYPKVCSPNGDGGDLVYELQFETMPDVPLMDIDGITLKEIEVKIGEEDIDTFIKELSENYPGYERSQDNDRRVAVGDRVIMSYRSSFKGKALKGGSGKGVVMVIGKGRLLKDFEDQIVGMAKGESKDFLLRFPDDYQAKHFAGKSVEMHVDLEDIWVPVENGDDREVLAKRCGFRSAEDMVKFATNGMTERFARMSESLLRKELFEHMDKEYTVEVPEYIVAQEASRMRRDEGRMGSEDGSVDEEAARRVKLGMLLMKVANDAKVAVESSDIAEFIRANYSSYGKSMEDVMRLFKSNRGFRDHVGGKVLEDKVVKYVISRVKKDKQCMSTQELKALFADS